MSISYLEKQKCFHLETENTSYLMHIYKEGHLVHLYWGKRIKSCNPSHFIKPRLAPWDTATSSDNEYSLDTLPQEYPSFGHTDLHNPAYIVEGDGGNIVSRLIYLDHEIIKGKGVIEGLPSTYVEDEKEATTLIITLYDNVLDLEAKLFYTVFEKLNAITRHVEFLNKGENDLKLQKALSMSVEFQDDDFDMIQLSGAWARERHVIRRGIYQGNTSIGSDRGGSSHQHNPFLALARKDATEKHGDVYGMSLVYSGNFIGNVEVDHNFKTRVAIGISPLNFSWILIPSEKFATPEVVMVYSDIGLGEMSRTYHKLYRTRLCRGVHRDLERPILVNNWEATYFDFDEKKLIDIADVAKDLGIELFVLDDGWFGKRNNDDCSLGDWVVNKEKLPSGLGKIASNMNDRGLMFGLWFEPEMVSPDSDLYRLHEDWCLHVKDRHRSLARNQLILDLSRKDVQDYIINSVSDVLKSANIKYVKWDMNRHMSEVGSEGLPCERQKETAHRYILGLYRVMESITSKFPDILFESCSGGGGRFDPGMLFYMPQTWTSDNTDAVCRLKIQYGTSLVYPVSSMGAHISAVPNHQVNRSTPLATRGNVAMSGNFGYELDLAKMSNEDKEEMKQQVDFYKKNREWMQKSNFYRLISPFETNRAAWMLVSEDKKKAVLMYAKTLAMPNSPFEKVKLEGLDPNFEYELSFGIEESECYGGDELMYSGLILPKLQGDYSSILILLEA